MSDWMVGRANLPGNLPTLNLNDPDGRFFVDDGGTFLFIGQEYEVATEGRPWMHHDVDVSRRRKASPWTLRVHFAGPTQADAVANVKTVLDALFRQPGEYPITVVERGLSYPYGCRARVWRPVLDEEHQWWSKGRLTVEVEVQARLLPDHPLF